MWVYKLDSFSKFKREILYEAQNENYPTSITLSKSYLLFDYLEIFVNLDGTPLEKGQKHGYVMPIDKNLYGIAASINQYGIMHTNYVQIMVTKKYPTIVGISDTGVAIVKVNGVNIN